MTLAELHHAADTAQWFKNMGTFTGDECLVPLRNLEAWGSGGTASDEEVADTMTWLPTSSDGEDPFHDWVPFKKTPHAADCIDAAKLVYKLTLISLRNMAKNELLFVSEHNFTQPARGAALFAFYSAALEITFAQLGPWIQIVKLYNAGHWPCGILPDKRIVVL